MLLTPEQCEEALDLIETKCYTLRKLGEHFGCSHQHVKNSLKAHDANANDSRLQSARVASSDAWLERGMEVLERALPKDSGLDGNVARAIAQECARRAAIVNPACRDNSKVELTGANGGPIDNKWTVEFIRPKDADATGSE